MQLSCQQCLGEAQEENAEQQDADRDSAPVKRRKRGASEQTQAAALSMQLAASAAELLCKEQRIVELSKQVEEQAYELRAIGKYLGFDYCIDFPKA